MSKAVSLNDSIVACLDGVKKAFNHYYKWSGGYWLGQASEGLMQSEIAKSLAKVCPFVTIEDTVRNILKEAEASVHGCKPRKSAKGRVDIVAWWAKDQPRLLIEVKRAFEYKSINNDAKRIKQLLNRGGSLQGGLIIVYTDAETAKTIENRFNSMAKLSGTTLHRKIINKKIEDGKVRHWGSGCFIIKKE